MFNLAIDSLLRGCDFVRGTQTVAVARTTIRQRKTGRPVGFELSEDRHWTTTCERVAQKAGQFLFPGRRAPDQLLTTRQYARLVSSNKKMPRTDLNGVQ